MQYSDSESDDEPISRQRQSSVELWEHGRRLNTARSRSRPVHSERLSQSSASVRSVSPPPADKSRKRARLSPRRWDRPDSYIVASHGPDSYVKASRRESDGRRWNHRDSWVNDEVKGDVKRHVKEKRTQKPKAEAVLIPERPASVHRGMRGWGEVEQTDDVTLMDVDQDFSSQPKAIHNTERQEPHENAQTPLVAKPSLELRILGIADRAVQPETARVPSTGISYKSDWEDRALDSAIWTGTDSIEAPKGGEKDAAPNTAQHHEKPHDLTRTANRERLLARLEREKKQQANALEQSPGSVTAKTLTATESTATKIQKATNPQVVEAEAKAKARLQLQLKLRLEREKAAAAASVPQADNAANPVDRTAALRAKLLEKKLAASQAQ